MDRRTIGLDVYVAINFQSSPAQQMHADRNALRFITYHTGKPILLDFHFSPTTEFGKVLPHC